MIKRSRLGTSLQTDKQQCTWNITYNSNNSQSCKKKTVTSFRPRFTIVTTSDKTLMFQKSKERRSPDEWYIITGDVRGELENHLLANNQQFNSFVVLFVVQKELRAFIQHLRVRVLIKILSYDLKGSKLLRWETQIQCFCDVTTLRKKRKKSINCWLIKGAVSRLFSSFCWIISLLTFLGNCRPTPPLSQH